MPVVRVTADTTNEAIEKVRSRFRGTNVAVSRIIRAKRVGFSDGAGLYRVSYRLKRRERFR